MDWGKEILMGLGTSPRAIWICSVIIMNQVWIDSTLKSLKRLLHIEVLHIVLVRYSCGHHIIDFS